MKQFTRRPRTLFFQIVVIGLLIVGPASTQAQKITYDSGPIALISEEKITVQGNLGVHVLEPIGDCTWCEVGLEVLIEFQDLSRVVIKPYNDSSFARPIRAFIVVDGRPD